MIIRFFILICIFCNLVIAGESDFNIEGEGRFISEEGDSLPFIKEQLLFDSFRDVVTKYLKKQGLNSDLFWERQSQRFEAFFKPIEKEIRENYSEKDAATREPLNKLEKEIRIKKLERRSNFGILNRSIKSYSINSMTRAPNMPNARYINITAKVDSNLINQIYFEYVSPKKIVKGLNLYILPLFSLSNMSWSDAGVGTVKDFSEVVSDHWKKYLENGLKEHINEITLLDESAQGDLRSVFEARQKSKGFFELADLGAGSFSRLEDGFLLLIKVKMRKISEKILLKKSTIEFNLNYTLVDMRNNKIIDSFDIPKKPSSFSTENLGQLSSTIATSVYRIPLEAFNKIKRDITSNLKNSNIVYLRLSNIKSVEDLLSLQETLNSKGVPFQLISKIHSLKASEGILEFEFNGTQAQVEQFLKGIERERLMDGREMIFEGNNGDYALAIKSLETEKNLDESGQSDSDEKKNRVVL